MYYSSRIGLGQALGGRVSTLKGEEAVVIALKEEALMACLGLASEIHAWVFPLLSEQIRIPGDPRVIGLLDPTGSFTWNPDFAQVEREGIEMESHSVLEDAKRVAFSKLNRQLDKYGELSKESLHGRTLLLTGDIVEDRIEIAMALEYLKTVRYEKLYGLGGNVEPEAATFFHLQTDESIALDILANMFPADHYFEQNNDYTPEETMKLMFNISEYWK